ncbi:MAG TPA: serine hydrolase domain-containing protein [Candidatus Cybelea sp.]|nr:serine hydrolase domain-containing protein [Candidatus Cybelea sp.]
MREPQRFERVDGVLLAACGVEFTAAVARVEHGGGVVFERAYGATRADACGRSVFCDTRFDLASLTKLFVATLALALVAQGRLDLDEPLARIVAEWEQGAHETITARMLLAHDSGMNSGADYRAILDENVERFALRSALLAPPGQRVIYSDLGFIALGAAIERVAGRSLPPLVADAFGGEVGFRPREPQRREIPATEEDDWRGRVQGVVHDEKAYLMGGVAGHAGLFGTAASVAAMTERYLGAFAGRTSKALPESLVREAVREQAFDAVLRRGLGWALKTNDENSCGRWFDRSSFGHTGFVGTCVWADPTRDIQGVLLTNAVYFGRDAAPSAPPGLRIRFYEAIVEDLGLK